MRRNVVAAGVLSAGLLAVVGVAAAYGGSAPEPAGNEIVLDSPLRSTSSSTSSSDQAVAELTTTTAPIVLQQPPAVQQQEPAPEPEPEPTITTITTTTAPQVEPEPAPDPVPGQREPSTVSHTPTCATYLPDGSCLSWA